MNQTTPKYHFASRILLILIVFITASLGGYAADLTVASGQSLTITTGSYNNVTVNGTLNVTGNLTVTGTLTVNGNLYISGSLSIGNNGDVITGAGSVVIIFGDAELSNKSSINLSSYFIVLGDLTKSGDQSDKHVDATVDDASIYVFGSVDGFGNQLTKCEEGTYDGTTTTVSEDCDAGGITDFINNVDSDDLPEGVYESIVSSSTQTDYFANSGAYCQGTDLVLKSYSEPVTKVTWYFNGTALIKNSSYLTWTTDGAGEYQAVYKVGSTWYTATAEISTFQTNPLSMP